jgi:hypothetical protein
VISTSVFALANARIVSAASNTVLPPRILTADPTGTVSVLTNRVDANAAEASCHSTVTVLDATPTLA